MILSTTAPLGGSTEAAAQEGAADEKAAGAVCLTTQWYPETKELDDETENAQLREIVRQGVLVAIREELELPTRDETLGEAFPENAAPLQLRFDLDDDGAWRAELTNPDAAGGEPLWKHEGRVDFEPRTINSQLVQQMTDLSGELVEALRRAGYTGEAGGSDPKNTPGQLVEKLLREMNIGSQFAAVRSAHVAIREDGESLALLGALVRGYSHLALLTSHYWSSHSEAFSARSLLYAERLVRVSKDHPVALWHRAYALALVGAHGAAIDQLEAIEKQSADADSKAAAPPWATLIEPYVEFDREALTTAMRRNKGFAEVAALLRWQVDKSFMHGRWIYERGLEAQQAVPEVYDVYAVMADWPALRISRTGAGESFTALTTRLPARVAALPVVPEAARAAASSVEKGAGGAETEGSSALAALIAVEETLIDATTSGTDANECTWSILSALLREERFIGATNLMNLAANYGQESESDLAMAGAAMASGHRYAAYAESYSVSPGEVGRVSEILAPLRVVDPRGHMRWMFKRMWHETTAGYNGNELAWGALRGRSFTHGGLAEAYYKQFLEWKLADSPERRQKFASYFPAVSPHSPQAIRLKYNQNGPLNKQQLADWETVMGDDPIGWMSLGFCYGKLKDYDNAERCYRRSIEISPSQTAVEKLAETYERNGKPELWQPTLESYLKEVDLSLSFGEIHQKIAERHVKVRAWAKAESHALAAAETRSGWGMGLAADVYEGMQDWKQSEHFTAESAKQYPWTSSGVEWYFWCCRTGRGDLAAARELADAYLEMAAASDRFATAHQVFVARVLHGDLPRALEGLETQLAKCIGTEEPLSKCWRLGAVAAIAGRAQDEARKERALQELRSYMTSNLKEAVPLAYEGFDVICRAFEGEEIGDDDLKRFREVLAGFDVPFRNGYFYLLGEALDLSGDAEEAQELWREVAFRGPFRSLSATLAGARLVERLGTDRGGMPEELAKQEAEAAKLN